jgi:hypothetical protein
MVPDQVPAMNARVGPAYTSLTVWPPIPPTSLAHAIPNAGTVVEVDSEMREDDCVPSCAPTVDSPVDSPQAGETEENREHS